MAVNISALQFRQENFIDRVRAVIASTWADPSFLELELTENILMHNAPSVLCMLNELKVLGLRLAIDDFGTGFSSLSYLLRFPIDRLKIDRSFVHDIGKVSVNESIVRAISVLAQSLGLETIADGTETDDEVAFVRDCRCDEAQGFRFCKPLPAEHFVEWVTGYVGGYAIRDFFVDQEAIDVETITMPCVPAARSTSGIDAGL
jgi:EAL domain-containing protein (putative c-di-GMP-specific phosphodiesterase class I)